MTQEQINHNKERYISLCKKYITREGLEKVLSYLENHDFYVAPSSVNYHLNEKGGLCQHSINVFETALRMYESVFLPAIESGNGPFTEPISLESIAICTLFHDLCKIDIYKEIEKWRKDERGRWESYPGYEIQDDFPLGHGEKSYYRIISCMKLNKDELLAIRWHMGMFDLAPSGTSQNYSFRNAVDQSPLVTLVHAADFISSNILEKTTSYK